MATSFWQQFIQPERRLQIRATIEEMHAISSILYAGVSVSGIIALNLPIWPGIEKTAIYILCSLGILLATLFYMARKKIPLWLAVMHMPVGITLLTLVVYFAHAAQSVGLAAVYILGSAYTFHYFSRITALVVVAFSMFTFAIALYLNDIEGWQSIVFFIGGCCILMGKIVRVTVSQLNFLAVRDSLTGLLNRRTIDALTNELLLTTQETGKAFTFILLDLNKFKVVNDTNGHLFGDQVLKQFSEELTRIISKDDHVARWGGDEFIIILDNSDKSAADDIETKLRLAVEDVIDFEIGVSYPQKEDTMDSLMHRADEGMYQKKRHRRITDQ